MADRLSRDFINACVVWYIVYTLRTSWTTGAVSDVVVPQNLRRPVDASVAFDERRQDVAEITDLMNNETKTFKRNQNYSAPIVDIIMHVS